MRALALLVFLSFSSTACVSSVHEYSATGYAPVTRTDGTARARTIVSEGSQHVVLSITDNTDYVDRAYAGLLAQCEGDIVGLNVRYSSGLSFLSYTNHVRLEAQCLAP